MPSIETLTSAAQWINIIVGIGLLFFGLIGTVANIFVFASKRFRKTPCAQYILAGSLSDLVIFGFVLLTKIGMSGFGWPTFYAMPMMCALRGFVAGIVGQVSVYSTCLTAFDRWASTSRSVSVRRWSTVKRARILTLINVLVWVLIALPLIPLNHTIQIQTGWQCIITSTIYLNYFSYFFVPVINLALPLLMLGGFGIGAYINITKLGTLRGAERLERQFARMILTQSLVTVIAYVPFGGQYIYSTITANWQKDPLWLAVDRVISQTSSMISFITYTTGFYVYAITSSEIRSTIKGKILKLLGRVNRVEPIQTNVPLSNRGQTIESILPQPNRVQPIETILPLSNRAQ